MGKAHEDVVREALKVIVKNKEAKALNYAINYAETGLAMTGYSLKVQCLYVLNNIVYWRGKEAKEVRKILKDFVKE